MPIKQNLVAYHESISEELEITKNRIRNLIGSAHWQTDGEHKESVLRRVMRVLFPETFRIGRGFVCYPSRRTSSGQIDILITPKASPTLYKDVDLVFVTPDVPRAVIEVKTKLTKGKIFEKVLCKLADELGTIRRYSAGEQECWGGLFVYDSHRTLTHKYILETLQSITKRNRLRAINCVSIGTNTFVRFWPFGHPGSSPERKAMWHSYNLASLSQPYFISNAIFHLQPNASIEAQLASFPIPNTKETKKFFFARLNGSGAIRF